MEVLGVEPLTKTLRKLSDDDDDDDDGDDDNKQQLTNDNNIVINSVNVTSTQSTYQRSLGEMEPDRRMNRPERSRGSRDPKPSRWCLIVNRHPRDETMK